jgi:P pilus assembly chaperone PapD
MTSATRAVNSDYKILWAPATATPTPTPLNTAAGNYRWIDKKTVRTVNNDSSMDEAPSAPLRVGERKVQQLQ